MNIKIVFVLVLFGKFANAQEVWHLQKCLDFGKANILEVKLKNLEQKRIEKETQPIILSFLPQISFNGSHTYNFGSTIDPSTNGRVSSNIQYDNFFISAGFNLFDFNSLILAKKGKLEIEKAKVEVQVINNEYDLQIIESYFQALYTQELLKIQQNQLLNTKSILNQVTTEVEIGSKPKSDLYDMQLSTSQEEKNLLETQNLLQTQLLSLFRMINNNTIDVSKVELLKDNFDINYSKTENSKIKSIQFDEAIAKQNTTLAKVNMLPKISAFYQYSTFYYRSLNQSNDGIDNFATQISNNQNHQIGLQLSIPIFGGLQNSRKIAVAKLQNQEVSTKLELEKQKQNKLLENENVKLYQLKTIKTKLDELKLLANKTLKTSTTKYFVGKIDASILSNIKNQYLNTEYEVLKNNLQIEYLNMKMKVLKN